MTSKRDIALNDYGVPPDMTPRKYHKRRESLRVFWKEIDAYLAGQKQLAQQATIPPDETPEDYCGPPRFFPYARCSHRDSVESGIGLEVQEEVCKRYYEFMKRLPDKPQYRQMILMPIMRDEAVQAWSKRLTHRPEGARLNSMLRRGDVVCLYKLDRGFRNIRDQLETLDQWKARGVTLISATESIDFATAMGMMIATVLGAVAEWYSMNLSERLMHANLHSKKMLGRLRAPYGYKWVWDKAVGMNRLVVDERIRWCGQKIRELRAQGMKYTDIAQEIERHEAQIDKRPFVAQWFGKGRVWTPDRVKRAHRVERRLAHLEEKYQAAGLTLLPLDLWEKTRKKDAWKGPSLAPLS